MSKLRKHDTLGFRPDNSAQEKLILDAQKATGIKMSDLLRRAVLCGLPVVVAEVQAQQQQAFAHFQETLREAAAPADTDKASASGDISYQKSFRKRKEKVA